MLLAKRLHYGDEIRVIAPSKSLSTIPENVCGNALKYLTGKGLRVTFSKHCREIDDTGSSSIQSRVEDLHDAFADKNVKAIITARGGANANQILEYIDYSLIRENPKIFCGFSDITALLNAITAKTGLVTYNGPIFGSFDSEEEREYTFESFESCVMKSEPFRIEPSAAVGSYTVLQPGSCEGQLFGGNLCTFNLLQGTEFMPCLNDTILVIEQNSHVDYFRDEFDRNLQSLLQGKEIHRIKALIFGRFRDNCQMNADVIEKIIRTKKQLLNIPVLFNVDFGHVYPLSTIPIGGTARITTDSTVSVEIVTH